MRDDNSQQQFEQDQYEQQYAEYIMEHCAGDRVISNGNDLLKAVEEGYLYTEFINSKE
jgi:hypothetical protein